jgi:hypothetical protein
MRFLCELHTFHSEHDQQPTEQVAHPFSLCDLPPELFEETDDRERQRSGDDEVHTL